MQCATIEEASAEIQAGRLVIIVDDEDRENEGDLMIAAEMVTPEAINFMATHGRGLICLPMTGPRLDELQIPLMVSDYSNTSQYGTAFCVSIEARRNVSTGISAFDRAQTILTAIDAKTRANDLVRPGHIFPLRARDGGVLVRAGQIEASVDLANSPGLTAVAVLLYLHQMGRTRRGGELEYHGKYSTDSNETIGLQGEQREYGIGAQILASLNIRSMRIITNHPRKLVALQAYGLQIAAQVPFMGVRTSS